jgi:translation elongation factor P/translation initiation factor 5A
MLSIQAADIRKGDYINGVGHVLTKKRFSDVQANKGKQLLPQVRKIADSLQLASLCAKEERDCYFPVDGSVEITVAPHRTVRYRSTDLVQVLRIERKAA